MSKNKGFSITSAERYSLALYELASENNVLSQVEDQSSSILNLISSSKDFSNLIKDPTSNQDDLLLVKEHYFHLQAHTKLKNIFQPKLLKIPYFYSNCYLCYVEDYFKITL